MGYLSQFKIPFVGLSLGEHKFEYSIDNQFFEQFQNALITKGKLHVDLLFKKQETMLLLDFFITGILEVKCDLCAEDFDLPVNGESNLIIKLGEEDRELNENMIVINRHAHDINIAQYVYEFITLMLPQKIIHPDDERGNSTCNKKTLKAIRQLTTKHHESDPRWEALKKLKL